MRIGEPAWKHGLPESDIRHAVRHAMRRIAMDEELTMLIGPAEEGALLEIGVLDLAGDDPVVYPRHAPTAQVLQIPLREVTMVRHTNDKINRAADRFEELADELDPSTAQIDHVDDLRQIAAASETVRTDEARLRENIEVARAHGRSWNQIAIALGVSRQAARQRYNDKLNV